MPTVPSSIPVIAHPAPAAHRGAAVAFSATSSYLESASNQIDSQMSSYSPAGARASIQSARTSAQAGVDLLKTDTTFGGEGFATLAESLLTKPLAEVANDLSLSGQGNAPSSDLRLRIRALSSTAIELTQQLTARSTAIIG